MDNIKEIMSTQLTEKEVVIYFLVQHDDLTYRKIGNLFGMSHSNIQIIYDGAKKKIDRCADAGFFKSPLGAVDKGEKKD